MECEINEMKSMYNNYNNKTDLNSKQTERCRSYFLVCSSL